MLKQKKIVDGIFLVYSDFKFWFKSGGILIKNNISGDILIDCNCYLEKEVKGLLRNKIDSYFVSHMHLDHTYNLHFFEELNSNIKIYCPFPENKYLTNFNIFLEETGLNESGLGELYRNISFESLKYKELNSVIGFTPGVEFAYDDVKIKTIHVPGHSPGHTAFIIEDTKENKRKILFASDIGLTQRGAWYGYTYSTLKDIKESVKKLEKIYLSDDFIIASSHGPIIFERNPEIFNNIIRKLDDIDHKLLTILDDNKPKSVDELMYKGLIYEEDQTNQLDDDPLLSHKSFTSFLERNMIMSHINDLVERKKIIEIDNKSWILNS